jgi:MFS family permease
VALVSAATALSLLGDQVLYSVLPVYFETFGLAPFQVGILLSANRWIRLLTNHLAHVTHRRVAPQIIFPAALTLGVATTCMYLGTASFLWLLAARVLWGLAWSYIRHTGVLAIMARTPAHRAGETMGYYNGVSRVGSVAGLFGGALLVEALGYTPAILLLALASATGIPLAMRVRHFVADEESGATDDDQQEGTRVLLLLGFILGAVGPGFVMSTLGYVLSERLGDSANLLGFTFGAATFAGSLLAIRLVLDTFFAPILGALGDRVGVRRAGVLFFAAGALALVGAALVTWTPALALLVIGFFMCGTALTAALGGNAANRGSRIYSRYVSAADVGAATGPLLGWSALELIAEPTLGLILGAAFFAVATLVMTRFPSDRP